MKKYISILLLLLSIYSINAVAIEAKEESEKPEPTATECAIKWLEAPDIIVSRYMICDYDTDCEGDLLQGYKIDRRCAKYISF